MAVEIGLHFAIALGLAAIGVGVVDIGVVVDLGEGLERHAQPVGVMQDAVMMMRQPPGTGIDVLAGIELDMLGGAAEFGVSVAAIERPVPPAGAAVIFQHLHFVARIAQLDRRRHARDARAQDENRGAGLYRAQFRRTGITRLLREAHFGHRAVHGGRSRQCADHVQQ